ncbi:hypothetical protein GGD70_003887 [Paraburkholderia fungorum]|nr:hypothetical protein [Paraburkholderia fungorum]
MGHEVRSIADVRSTDARRRERDTPDGVTHRFQVSLNKVDPRVDVLARNLFSKDDWRPALADEPCPSGPKVPLVSKPSAFACRAERLARTGTGPNRSIVRPASESKRVRPDTDSGEEMALGESEKVVWSDIFNAPFINVAGGNVTGGYQVAQPLRSVWVDLVVVSGHLRQAAFTSRKCQGR